MKIVTLSRGLLKPSARGTFGVLDTGSFKCVTLERPPVGMVADHPCIPVGEYNVSWTTSHPHHNPCYEIMNVPGRTAILIHPANWMEELLGCIAPGKAAEIVQGKLPDGTPIKAMGVSGSRTALADLIEDLNQEAFSLVIKEM